jgi:hypothetical protein
MLIERLGTEFLRWSATRASWFTLAVATYVLLAPNIDFAPNLTWHDGQRIAQLVLIGVIVMICFAMRQAGNAVADTWATLPSWSRIVLYAAFVLGSVSAS